MNLTTLKYIVALDNYRNFVKAAEACGVSQPSLSTAIKNMEAELDIRIFDRDAHPVKPTAIGEKIIAMARVTLHNAAQIEEFVKGERGEEGGDLNLGIIPTIAPYILPDLFRELHRLHPAVKLKVSEMRTSAIVEKLVNAELDMAILATPLERKELLEIPLYYEKFEAYVSPEDALWTQTEVFSDQLPSDRLWVLQEGHCLRSQVFKFCHRKSRTHAEYEAGSIDTLVRVVDANGGYTVIPELHVSFLSESQKSNVRPITGRMPAAVAGGESEPCPACVPVREVSLVIREDFVRERLLNIVATAVKNIIPEPMLDSRLKKFAIKI